MTRGTSVYVRGHAMRSQLEARWAAEWDARGWKWQYEPAKLQGSRGSYTPDFALVELRLWVEVKPLATVGEHLLGDDRQLVTYCDARYMGNVRWPLAVVYGTPERHLARLIETRSQSMYALNDVNVSDFDLFNTLK